MFGLWPCLRFGVWTWQLVVHNCCFCFREGGLSSEAVKLTGTFFRFGSWQGILDPCTWGLPHLTYQWGWPNLGHRVTLGHLDFRVRKEEAHFWTCLNTFSFLMCSWKFEECIFAMYGFWTWHFLVHSWYFCFREGGLSSHAVKLTGTCFCLCCLPQGKIDISPTFAASSRLQKTDALGDSNSYINF